MFPISLAFVMFRILLDFVMLLISLNFVMFLISLHFVNVPDFIGQNTEGPDPDTDPADPPIANPFKTKDTGKINIKPLKQNQFSAD